MTKAEAVARETGWNLEKYAASNDPPWSGVDIGPVGRHRDSEALDNSNFEVIYEDLKTRFPDSVDVVHFGHWAVGWVEEIAYDPGNADLVAAIEEWREKLDNYPVADEEHYSQLEWDENHPEHDSLCYSDDSDCGCGREKA